MSLCFPAWHSALSMVWSLQSIVNAVEEAFAAAVWPDYQHCLLHLCLMRERADWGGECGIKQCWEWAVPWEMTHFNQTEPTRPRKEKVREGQKEKRRKRKGRKVCIAAHHCVLDRRCLMLLPLGFLKRRFTQKWSCLPIWLSSMEHKTFDRSRHYSLLLHFIC